MTWNDFHSNKTFPGTAECLQAYYLASIPQWNPDIKDWIVENKKWSGLF